MCPPPLELGWRGYVFVLFASLSVCAFSGTQYFINCFEEFHQLYSLGEVSDDELVRLWGQKVKGHCHEQTKYGCKSSFGHRFITVEH